MLRVVAVEMKLIVFVSLKPRNKFDPGIKAKIQWKLLIFLLNTCS